MELVAAAYNSISEDEKMKKMETFIRSFHNGDYDIEFDNALRLDMDRYGRHQFGPPTQASYNKLDNWIERNRLGLERFVAANLHQFSVAWQTF